MNQKKSLLIQHPGASGESEAGANDWMQGAEALVIDPAKFDIDTSRELPVKRIILEAGDPERDQEWQEVPNCEWVCKDGLEQIAVLKELWPDLDWVPRLNVFRPEMSYRFSGPAIGEGFSFYIPDTSAIKAWRVTDQDLLLADAIQKVIELGFSRLWLHSLDAESKGQGLDLEMLDKALGSDLEIWVSGGVTDPRHLANLSRSGGASGVVVSERFARENGVSLLLQALQPNLVEQVVPVANFSNSQSK